MPCFAEIDALHRTAAAAPAPPLVDHGRAGASAQREYLRRKQNREARVRRRHPRIGGLMLALSSEPQHETAFLQGSRGEQSLGRSLERRTAKGPAQIIHDRRMPRGHGNIDHLAVAPTGVYVIDAKAIRGAVHVAHPLFGRAKLLVKGREHHKLIDGLDRQVAAVRQILARLDRADVPVHGVLCFTEAELPLFGGRELRGHRLRYPRATARALNRKGPLSATEIDSLVRDLAWALPPA
jgi:hypothetical protein